MWVSRVYSYCFMSVYSALLTQLLLLSSVIFSTKVYISPAVANCKMEYSQLKIDLQFFFHKFDDFSKTVLQEIDDIKTKLDKLQKVHDTEKSVVEDRCNKETQEVTLQPCLEEINLEAFQQNTTDLQQTAADDLPIFQTSNKKTSSQTVPSEFITCRDMIQNNTVRDNAFNEKNTNFPENCAARTLEIVSPILTNCNSNNTLALKINKKQTKNFRRLVEEKFASFAVKELRQNQLKVIAGFVMTRESNIEVISVAMGTKCIFDKNISWDGGALNDMHAEVAARRSFVSYLFDQLNLLTEGNEQSIFVQRENEKGYRLRDGIHFHLYISIAPCGDANVSDASGLLRTKIESKEGTFPATDAVVQTWEKISNGQKLKTMSCSDKICRWNVVGLQGSLLSHFIEPIYLESIIIGSQTNLTNLRRATYERLAGVIERDLSSPYRLNCPSVFTSVSEQRREYGEAPNVCVNWNLGRAKPEVLLTTTGQPKLYGFSKYCKWEFMRKFMKLKNKISSITDVENSDFVYYNEIKEAAISYKETKETLYKAFRKAGLGNWVSKPEDQDYFEM